MSTGEEEVLRTIDDRISYVLEHPGMSSWLKQTLKSALDRSPVDILNDLEILEATLRARATALAALPSKESP